MRVKSSALAPKEFGGISASQLWRYWLESCSLISGGCWSVLYLVFVFSCDVFAVFWFFTNILVTCCHFKGWRITWVSQGYKFYDCKIDALLKCNAQQIGIIPFSLLDCDFKLMPSLEHRKQHQQLLLLRGGKENRSELLLLAKQRMETLPLVNQLIILCYSPVKAILRSQRDKNVCRLDLIKIVISVKIMKYCVSYLLCVLLYKFTGMSCSSVSRI